MGRVVLSDSVQRYTGIFIWFQYLTHTGSNCKSIEISCIDLNTFRAMLDLHVHYAGLIQIYTLN